MKKFLLNPFVKIGVLLLGLFGLVALAWLWKNPASLAAPDAQKMQAATAQKPAGIASTGVQLASQKSSGGAKPNGQSTSGGNDEFAGLTYATGWGHESKPAFAPFNAWVKRYLEATGGSRDAMVAEGEALAKNRREAMEKLIQTNPEEAIASTVPAAVLGQLPGLLLAQVEKRVAGRGDYKVAVVCFTPRLEKESDSVMRQVVLGQQKLNAFTYGFRLAEGCKNDIPIHGIALGKSMALHPSPVRVLEAGESIAPGAQILQAPTPTGGNLLRIQVGSAFFASISASQTLQLESELLAAEAGLGPVVQPSGLAAQLFPITALLPAKPWTTGTQRVLIIRVDFSDLSGNPVSQAGGTNVMDLQAKPFYEQSSYYQDTLVSTVSSGVYRMPKPADYYATNDANDELHNDAELAALSDYDVYSYDRIGVVFPNMGGITDSQITYGGLAEIGGKNFWANGEFDLRIVAHELGHTYGLHHANLWQIAKQGGDPITTGTADAMTVEYGDDYDMMGGNFMNLPVDFAASRKLSLKWISPEAVVSATTSGVYRIYRLDDGAAHLDHPMALKVSRPDGLDYWIELHKKSLKQTNLGTSAHIVWANRTSFSCMGTGSIFVSGVNPVNLEVGYTNLLDLTTPGNSINDAGLSVGASLTDPTIGVTITPVGTGGAVPSEYLDVQISFNNSVRFVKPAYEVLRNDAVVNLEVERTGDGIGKIEVRYATYNGSAKAPDDYKTTFGTLVWKDGDLSKHTIPVKLGAAQIANGSAVFHMELSHPVGGVISQKDASVTISEPGMANGNFAPPTRFAPLTDLTVDTAGNVTIDSGTVGVVLTGSFVPNWGPMQFENDQAKIESSTLSGGLNGDINSVIIQPDQKILVAGAFDKLALQGVARVSGVNSGTVVAYSGTLSVSGTIPGFLRLNPDGSIDTSFDFGTGIPDAVNEPVKTMALQPDGKVLIAGNFLQVQGNDITRIARLEADGSFDWTFDPEVADGEIRALAVQPDSRILIGGAFQTVSGTSTPFIARLNQDGSRDSSFTSPLVAGTTGAVECIAVQPDGAIVLGGSFVSGTSSGVVRLLASGSLDLSFNAGIGAFFVSGTASVPATVRSLAIQPDGKIVVGGTFNQFAGAARKCLVRINPDGSLDGSFAPSVDPTGKGAEIRAIAVDPTGILIAGEFSKVNSVSAQRFAKLKTDGSLDPIFFLGAGASNRVNSISLAGDSSFALGLSVNPLKVGDPSVQGLPDRAVALFCGNNASAGQVQFDSSSYGGDAPGSVQVIVQRIGGVSGAISVSYSTIDGVAVAGTDYVAASGILTWADGDQTPKFLEIQLTGSNAAEFFIQLCTPIGGVQLGSQAWASIDLVTGNHSPDKPLNIDPADSSAGLAQLVSLSASAFSDLDSDTHQASQWLVYRSSDGAPVYPRPDVDPAVDSVNLTQLGIPFQLDCGTSYTWQVRYLDSQGAWSAYSEPTTFSIHPVQAFAFTSRVLITPENATPVQIAIKRTSGTSGALYSGTQSSSVVYTTRQGSARDGFQFLSTSGTLIFTGTENTGAISIPIIDNMIAGPDTEFYVDLMSLDSEWSVSIPTATVVIQDDEFPSFSSFRGSYFGLVGSNPASSAETGSIDLSMDAHGGFTATISYGGKAYKLKGRFGPRGTFSGTIPKSNLKLELALDLTGSGLFTGTVSDGITAGTFNADLAVFDAKRFPASQKGTYTFLITADKLSTGNEVPQGTGYGTITVDGSGKGRLAGVLGDGTKVTQILHLSKTGACPFYLPLYKNLGSISGALQFSDLPKTDVAGDLAWFKPVATKDKLFPAGWPTLHPTLEGARYVAPPKGTRVLPYSNSAWNTTFTISAGSVAPTEPFKRLSWLSDNKVVSDTLKTFKMTINPSSGLFRGSFLDEGSGSTKTCNGILLQKANIGGGFFLGNEGTTGNVTVEELQPDL